ncbi:MAG: type IV toxin-antitoxin system AbiEi family antitoxin domain-containing protein [Candidatus Omnitrophota bacterium]
MDTKNIILAKNDSFLIEEAIARYGRIVSFEQLQAILKQNYSTAAAKNRISRLSKLGWLMRIKKGLYTVVSDIGSRGLEDVSLYGISKALNKNSYVSFENALRFHGMFDQMLSTLGAVTFDRARHYKLKDAEVRFFKIKKNLYFGFSEERSDVGSVNIAHKEKAILDILYFRSNVYYAGLVWEKLKEYKASLDFSMLKDYASKFGYDVIRQVGFFLDRLEIDSEELSRLVRGKTSYGRMTREAKDFDAKWRLYFERRIVE